MFAASVGFDGSSAERPDRVGVELGCGRISSARRRAPADFRRLSRVASMTMTSLLRSDPPSTVTPTTSAGGAPPVREDQERPLTVISPRSGRATFRELWQARETAWIFALRDIRVRYKQSLIGIGWAVIQPLMTMVVFTVIFGKFAKFDSEGFPFQVFLFAALLPWIYFAASFSLVSSSVMSGARLVQKVFFPRLLLPISATLVPAVDFLASLPVLAVILVWFDVPVQPTVVFAPLFLILMAVVALGVGAFFAVLNVRYRDVPYAIPFFVQLGLYGSGVMYSVPTLPEKWQRILAFNPVATATTGFRWSLIGTDPPRLAHAAIGLTVALVVAAAGIAVFRRFEPTFADTL